MMWRTTRSSRTNPHLRTAAITRTRNPLTRRGPHILMDSRIPGQAAASRLAGSRVARATILAVLSLLLPLEYAKAHDPGLSSLTIRQPPNGLEATLTLAVKDASQIAELDEDHDGIVTQAEFARARSQLETAIARQLCIVVDGKVARAQSVRSQLDKSNNVQVCLDFRAIIFSNLEIQSKIIASLPLGHRQYLQIQNSRGETIFERLLSAAADRTTVEMHDAHSSNSVLGTGRSFANFLCLGVKHILTGYDHLLFLFGLLLVARGFFSSLGIITSFTIAHSITLAVATLHLVQIPSGIVEPLIAA